MFLVVYILFITIGLMLWRLIIRPLELYFLIIPLLKKGTSVWILRQENGMFLRILHLLNMCHSSFILIFKRRYITVMIRSIPWSRWFNFFILFTWLLQPRGKGWYYLSWRGTTYSRKLNFFLSGLLKKEQAWGYFIWSQSQYFPKFWGRSW